MTGRRRHRSVRTYLQYGFALTLAAVTAMVITASIGIRNRERTQAAAALRIAANWGADYVASSFGPENSIGILGGLAEQPGIQALEAGPCRTLFATLASQTGVGHLHLFEPAGAQVCSLQAKDLPATPLPLGPWFAEVQRTGRPVVAGTGRDPLSGQPAVTTAVPVPAADGRVGALVQVAYTGPTPIPIPGDLSPETVLLVLDQAHRTILARSRNAPFDRDQEVTGTPLVRPVGGRGKTVDDADGRRRIYVEVPARTAAGTWHVLAGVPQSVATGPARDQFRRMSLIGGASLAVIAILGVFLERRLARPIRRVGTAIERAWQGDPDARAPATGPSEVVRVAEVFNELIEERLARERDLEYRANHDPLTQLPNRSAVCARLAATIDEAGDEGTVGALLLLDLDQFKLLNDSYGHSVGDSLLAQVGHRLHGGGGEALVGRFGGDEFVALAPAVRSQEDALALAARLTEALRQPFDVDGRVLYTQGSVGIALIEAGDAVEDVIRKADTAMYRAKANGAGRIAVFDAAMRQWSRRRFGIEQDLRRAIGAGQFRVHYQQVFALGAQVAPVGAEALLRWERPGRGLVPPGECVPVAEESGLVTAIGEWVLHRATAQANEWQCRRRLSVSVNVSAAQLVSRELVGQVEAALAEGNLPAHLLCLEVTETSLFRDRVHAARVLADLRRLGVQVAVDDFGTGQSSLAYLQELPVDEVKLDRSFVARLGADGRAAKLVESVVLLGHALDLTVTAEGVETVAQLELLRGMGCDRAQGFLLHRPQPHADLVAALAAGR